MTKIDRIAAAAKTKSETDELDGAKFTKLFEEHRGLVKRKGALLVAASTIMCEAQALEDRASAIKNELYGYLHPAEKPEPVVEPKPDDRVWLGSN